jgi:hypothetical protein
MRLEVHPAGRYEAELEASYVVALKFVENVMRANVSRNSMPMRISMGIHVTGLINGMSLH